MQSYFADEGAPEDDGPLLTPEQRRQLLALARRRRDEPAKADSVGKIPDSADNAGRAVVCSYFIFESTSTIKCATLGWITGPFV